MEIDKELYTEIKAYCDINGLKAKEYVHNLLKKAFMEDKYGKMPPQLIKKELKKTEMVVINDFSQKTIERTNDVGTVIEKAKVENGNTSPIAIKEEKGDRIVKTKKTKL